MEFLRNNNAALLTHHRQWFARFFLLQFTIGVSMILLNQRYRGERQHQLAGAAKILTRLDALSEYSFSFQLKWTRNTLILCPQYIVVYPACIMKQHDIQR